MYDSSSLVKEGEVVKGGWRFVLVRKVVLLSLVSGCSWELWLSLAQVGVDW